ncbi:hypothetical protein HYH03_004198 [Edaphochlamys debaryana]|uniref:Cytochrome P450 n=1 Tax=Edaphochlamys debaryana TaxID=47281 RepID=A0A836C2E7_9CHLO|nr:hypothetical protein HYH03_004198 [Edaphochlamys debaryana]|eukprot:KAG2497936.1 hypothetical protein HYH03_004198 [Edaphochlamys debaryana]
MAETTLALALAVVTTLAAGLYLLMQLKLLGKGGKLPPGPWAHIPLFGDGVYLAAGNPLKFFFDRFKRYGPVYRTVMLGSRAWIITDMEAMRGALRDEGAVLRVPFKSFQALMGGDSLLDREGAHGPWRRIFNSALGPPSLAAMVPRILAVMRGHLGAWEAQGRIPIYRAARQMGVDLGVDIITRVELSERVDRDWFKKEVETFLDGLYGLPLTLPGMPLAKALAARERLIAALMPEMESKHAAFRDKWAETGSTPAAFTSALLDVPGGVRSQAEVEAEADARAAAQGTPAPPAPASAFPTTPSVLLASWMGRACIEKCELWDAGLSVLHNLVASSDTTRFALFNTWTLLAMSPRVQEQLFLEQKKVVAQHGGAITYAVASQMPYMDATLKEAMRLLPASAGGLRELTADLRVGEHVIPKGEIVWYHAGLLHCVDPTLWDGRTDYDLPPHMDWKGNFEGAFRPERWLGEGPKPRHYTFGSGLHLCAGMQLVYLEIKLLLTLVLRHYSLRLETPDMLARCPRCFPFFVPEPGTDGVLLLPREEPLPTE